MRTKELNNNPTNKQFEIAIGETDNITVVSSGVIKFAHKRTIFGSTDPDGTGELKVKYDFLNAGGQDDNIIAKSIVLDSDVPLLILNCVNDGDNDYGKFINLNVKRRNEIPFTLFIQEKAIQDCKDRRIKSFKVKYTVSVKMDNDTIEKTVSDTITIIFKEINCAPEISLKDTEIKYKSGDIETELVFRNSSMLEYAPTLAVKPTNIYLEKKNQNKGTTSLSDIAEIVFNRAKPGGKNKDYQPYDPQRIVITGANEEQNFSDHIGCIHPNVEGYEMDVPLRIHMNKLKNPQEDEEEYTLVIVYDYWISGQDDCTSDKKLDKIEKISFNLTRNKEENKLLVKLSDENDLNKTVEVNEKKTEYLALPQPIDITYKYKDGRVDVYKFTIAIRNEATVTQSAYPEAGIDIRNLKISDLKLDNATAFNDKNIELPTQSYAESNIKGEDKVRLKPNEAITIGIKITTGIVNSFNSGSDIIFDANLRQSISFEYFVNNTGTDTPTEWTTWKGSVLFALQIAPKSEWLGVDFGTSAVVALYGDGEKNMRTNDCIQNLAVIKKKILEACYGKNNGYAKSTDEKTFINSNIVLGNGGTLREGFSYDEQKGKATTNYLKGIVLFSPGDQIDYNNLLPPLKSMMGHRFIPIGNKMLVDDVYETAYHQLFDLYLNRVSNGNPIEKIVMTYPNTFAVSHVAKLREMAKMCIPTLRGNFIHTISESDAIAYRYLLHDITKAPAEQVGRKGRRILVYDMGAGTLDLTYFTNIVREIDIVGKYGISKAGNYLDYVLAEIIAGICKKNNITIGGFDFDKAISYKSDRGDEIGNSFQLKKYVKNVLKPAMAKIEDPSTLSDDEKLPEWNLVEKLQEIPLKVVFDDKRFKEFIKEVSADVINGFRQNIKKQNNNNQNNDGLNIAEMKVDVLVFSGRMTQFKMIRNAVIEALGKDIILVDITDGIGGDALKASVVEGAVNYVEYFLDGNVFRIRPPRPFYCNYAVIASRYGKHEMHCFLNNRTPDYTAKEKIDFNGVNKLCLIQTYASDEKEILKDFDNNRDLTTILSERDTRNYKGDLTITIKVEIDEQNSLQQGTNAVTLMVGSGGSNALPQENLDSDSFRKSSWPVVFD